MTALGEFLERFYSPDEFFRTVHARVRHTSAASPQNSSTGGRPSIGRQRRDVQPGGESTEELVFWAHLPDKVRIETTSEREGASKTTVEVINGETSWQRHADGIVEKGGGQRKRADEICSLPTKFQRHFDRRLLRECFAALTLQFTGKCQVAGRECLTIRALQIPGTQLWPHWLSFNANEFEFAVEVEHAVLLSIKCMDGQATVEVHEVLEVTFDGKIDDSSFVYEPADNERVQPAIPVSEDITLEAAAARAPFAVLRPGYTPNPEQTHSHARYHRGTAARKVESLTVFYRGGDSYKSLWIEQRCEPDGQQKQELEWDEILVEGQCMEISDPHPDEGLRVLSCRREKTFVTIISDLPRDELVKIALSLTPIRKHGNKQRGQE